jgi:hypothetical protein
MWLRKLLNVMTWIRFVLAVALQVVSLPGASPYVLCTGLNGHSELEPAIAGRCSDAGIYNYSAAEHIAADECPAGCVDTAEENTLARGKPVYPAALPALFTAAQTATPPLCSPHAPAVQLCTPTFESEARLLSARAAVLLC